MVKKGTRYSPYHKKQGRYLTKRSRLYAYRKFDGKYYRYIQGYNNTNGPHIRSAIKDAKEKGYAYRIVEGRSPFGKYYRLYVRDKWAKKYRG